MAYREKTAWLSLIAMAVAFCPYFTIVAHSHSNRALPNLPQVGWFACATIVQVIVLGLGHAYLSRGARREMRMPPDERDIAIIRRSISAAYYVLITGMFLVGCVMPFNSNGWTIINAALLMIVLAEVVRYTATVVGYRRQA